MNARRLFSLALVLILWATLTGAAHGAPLAGPCIPGTAYDPACDANQDGVISVNDIQLTAGHWNQNGAFVSDNNHTHLGQTWTGNNNPLTLTGAFGPPLYAPLNLSNSAGIGLRITSTGNGSGIWIDSASSNGVEIRTAQSSGVLVNSAGQDGIFVCHTGTASTCSPSTLNNGVEIGNAQDIGAYVHSAGFYGVAVDSAGSDGVAVGSAGGDGVYVVSAGFDGFAVNSAVGGDGVAVGSAGQNGVEVGSAGSDGVRVGSAGSNGFRLNSAVYDGVHMGSVGSDGISVDSAGYSGVEVGSAGYYGVLVDSATYSGMVVVEAGLDGVYANTTRAGGDWGFYTPDAIHGSNVLLHSLSLVVQVSGPDSLTSGDIVAVVGVADPVPGSTVHTPLVRLAGGSFTNVVGVVESHLALTPQPSRPQAAEGKTSTETPVSELRSVEGPAQPGDYVAITVMGAAQVKVDTAATIAAGQRLTVATNGRARALGTIKVQLAGDAGTADLPEGAPVIGVAMEPAKDGLVWVLINPQ